MMTAEELSEQFQKLKKLDDVAIPFSPLGKWPMPAALMGFTAVFYFFSSDTSLPNFVSCINDYLRRTDGKLKKMSINGDDSCSIMYPISFFTDKYTHELYEKEGGFSVYLTSSAERTSYPAHYSLKSLFADDRGKKRLSRLQFSLPIGFLLNQKPGYAQEMIQTWSQLLCPFHGMAGIGLIYCLYETSALAAGKDVMEGLKRFPGLQADNVYLHSSQVTDGIIGVSWFTIVSTALLDKIGGKEALNDLGPDYILWDYPAGVGIISGPLPELGDKEHDLMPHFLPKIHSILRPIYSQNLKEIIVRKQEGISTENFTETWKYRYDKD